MNLTILPLIFALGCSNLHPATSPVNRILLSPSMLIDETATGGDLSGLVDEQTSVGDPASGQGITPTKPFFPGWGALTYPVKVAIDLGGTCHVDSIYIYNPGGDNPLQISTGTPRSWNPTTVKVTGYKAWNKVPIDTQTRWLRLTLDKPTSVSELVVYGSRLSPIVSSKATKARSHRSLPAMDQLIGTNAFVDQPIDKIATPGRFVREYHNWGWDYEGADHKLRYQPSGAAGGNSWFFDDYYGKLKAAGETVCPVVQGSLDWMFGKDRGGAKPIASGADPEDPRSYAFHAGHFFQVAARYGSRKVDESLLALAPGQPRRSGLGLLKYVENWNEPDNTWAGRDVYFSPYELAAMSSADYDGDQGRLGKAYGVKNADPGMKLSLAGLSGLSIPRLKAIKFWADTFRKGDFPADVINLHHYCTDSTNGADFSDKSVGISPEAGHLKERLTEFADWRDANIPDRELWLTEFGYDTHAGSPIVARPIGTMDSEAVQGAWLVRSFLELAAARVDRASMFMLADVNSDSPYVFATCGLTSDKKGNWKPKKSYFYVATLSNRLAGMRFGAEIPTGRPDVWEYRFDSIKGHRKAYVVWCPTSEDKHVSDFQLKIPSGTATLISLAPGELEGVSSSLKTVSAGVLLEVSETPSIVLVGEQ
jgi:hypothetical protein